MQALSMWPSKGGLCVVPQLDYEPGSCSFSSTRSKERCGSAGRVFHSTGSGLFMVFGNSMYTRNGACCSSSRSCSKSRFLSEYSKVKFLPFCEPQKGSFRSPVALSWALEQQEIGNEFHRVGSGLDDGFSGNGDSDDVDCHNSDKGEDDYNSSDDEENKRADFGSAEEFGENKKRRIDVRALGLSLHFAKTAEDVEEVLKDMGELPLQVYSSMIKGWGRSKKMESALAVVEWLRRKKETGCGIVLNIFIYNSLLNAVKLSKQYGEIEKIMNEMTEEGLVPDVVTYNTLMVIYKEQGKPAKALNILEQMHKKGVKASAASYSTALLAYKSMEDCNGALKLFLEIKEKYLKGEMGKDYDEDWGKEFIKIENFTIHIFYHVMRQWLLRHENLSTNVLKLLLEIDKAGLQPGRADYERIVWACTREDHFPVAKELYTRIRESYPGISLSVCNHVIWLMGKAKKWWAALEVYEDMLDKGPNPNNLTYELIVSHFNVLLTAARRRGIWRWGVRLLNKMEEKGLKPTTREWNAVLVACSKASETSAAVQIFGRMVERGEKPTVISYGALLSALEKGKLYDEAVRVWEHMQKVGVKPDLYSYSTMALVYTRQGNFRLVDAIINEMVSSDIEPTVVTYNAIISGCALNDMGSAAFEWFHRMKVNCISPNEITYEMLIEALTRDGKPRLASELYLRAQNEGLNLSSKAYDAIVDSSHVYGAGIDSSVLGPRPPEKKN